MGWGFVGGECLIGVVFVEVGLYDMMFESTGDGHCKMDAC